MRLLVSIDEHYVCKGGRVYSTEGTTPYPFWSQYLQVFDDVVILARVRHEETDPAPETALADGPRVTFLPLPDFRGPFHYIGIRKTIRRCVREAIPKADAYFLRGPGVIGGFLAEELNRRGAPYAAQVIGDPWEVFGSGGVGGLLRPFYRHLMTQQLKRICDTAAGVSYVTQSTLQRRYPASPAAFVSSWSDVRIGNGMATSEQLQARLSKYSTALKDTARIGFIGSFEQPYKGADILLRALTICRSRGIDVRADFVGEGRLRSEYEGVARQLAIEGYVRFVGRLGAGKPIFDFLDSIDLFVMPSLTEGLPRAMIEAMARGCPCIGSDVGGIPELLDRSDLVPVRDAQNLAEKLISRISSPSELAQMAIRNHGVAQRYLPQNIERLRCEFLNSLRNQSLARNTRIAASQAQLGGNEA